MIDLVDMIVFHADASPEKPAVITGQVILTYAMLRRFRRKDAFGSTA